MLFWLNKLSYRIIHVLVVSLVIHGYSRVIISVICINCLREVSSKIFGPIIYISNLELLRMGDRTGAYRVSVGMHEGRRPLGRCRLRWKHNINMGLQEVDWGAWTGLICLMTVKSGHLF